MRVYINLAPSNSRQTRLTDIFLLGLESGGQFPFFPMTVMSELSLLEHHSIVPLPCSPACGILLNTIAFILTVWEIVTSQLV